MKMLVSLLLLCGLVSVAWGQPSNAHLKKTKQPARGTFVIPVEKNEKQTSVKLFLSLGYDVCKIDYRADTLKNRSKFISHIQKIVSEMKKQSSHSVSLAGVGQSAYYCAMAAKYMDNEDLPENLILINPTGMTEKSAGTVFPCALPPYNPQNCRLLAIADSSVDMSEQTALSEYYKTWKGFDGGTCSLLISSEKEILSLKSDIYNSIDEFLKQPLNPEIKCPNPAEIAVEGYAKDRHAEKAALLKAHSYDMIFIGNSITHNFEKPEYQPVWNKYYGSRNALNLGTSAYRTENLVWEIENLDFSNQHPKVCVLGIGTNNIDEKNYPYRNTANELAGGIAKIVSLLRQKMPDTKIVVLRCFPGCYGGPFPTSHRLILEHASDIVSHLADNQHVFYCDVNHVFLNFDGSLNHEMLGDWLHPTPQGAEKWAEQMESLISRLMGDVSKALAVANTAIAPVKKLEEDSYNWYHRHAEVLRIKDSINPQVILVGNSITHFWGGLPALKYNDGTPRPWAAPEQWAAAFGTKRVLNLGFGWDRTQNVLWRFDHGELDALHPQTVIINIGTNNTSQTENARMNTAQEIAEGVQAVCMRVRSKLPMAKIILMAIFPREATIDNPRRVLINQTNELLKAFAEQNYLTYIDLTDKMLTSEGVLSTDICFDLTHPTPKGYSIWAEAIYKELE